MSKGRKRQYLNHKQAERWIIAYQDLFDWEEPELMIGNPLPLLEAEKALEAIIAEEHPQLGRYYLKLLPSLDQ